MPGLGFYSLVLIREQLCGTSISKRSSHEYISKGRAVPSHTHVSDTVKYFGGDWGLFFTETMCLSFHINHLQRN